MKRNALALAILAVLAGCGKEGIGVSADNSSGSTVETKSGLSWMKEISSGNSAKSTISMPASALIAEAMQEIVTFEGESGKTLLKKYFKDASSTYWTPLKSSRYVEADNLSTPDVLRSVKKDFEKVDSAPKPIAKIMIGCLDLGIKEKNKEAADCINKYNRSLTGAASIAVATMSLGGWPVDPYQRSTVDYLVAMSVNTEYANFISTELAAKLQGRLLRDPQDAKEQITAALFSIPQEKLDAFASEANKIATTALTASLSIDAATGKGVTWVANGIKYSNPGTGWTIARNGVSWFGEGKLSGKSYDLALESSVSANRTTRDQTDQSVGTSSQSSTKGNVGVK